MDGSCVTPGQQVSTDAVWQALSTPDALTTIGMASGFLPETGRRFRLRVPFRGNERAIDVEVLEVEAPKRLTFRWRAAAMPEPATAEVILKETADGVHFSIGRIGGDPATCRLATALLGRNWQSRLFNEAMAQHLALPEQG
ncbi:MAG TPA: SRPBCC domain-containing protein [Thermomicrobiales bacterium]